MQPIDIDYVLKTGPNCGLTVLETFMAKFVAGDVDECWEWEGKLYENGYGCFSTRGFDYLAHRVSYFVFNGVMPSDVVMHTCDNRKCVNPRHLVNGTQLQNMQDAKCKGRMRGLRGLASPRGVISDEDVHVIRRRRAAGEQCKEIAKSYAVSATQISRVSTGARKGYLPTNKTQTRRIKMKTTSMTIDEYSKLAIRTMNDLGPVMNLVHGALLVTSEAGEVADAVKKNVAYGRPLDRIHVMEECGDLLWGINLILHTTGITWEQVMGANIAKLEARYPDMQFDADKAINRDEVAEQAAMNKVG